MSDTTQAPAPTRGVDGHVLPAPGRWDIDPGHTDLAFVGRHFMVTKVRGRFTDVTGSVTIAERLGYTAVRKYREGIQDWVAAGNPTESTQPARPHH